MLPKIMPSAVSYIIIPRRMMRMSATMPIASALHILGIQTYILETSTIEATKVANVLRFTQHSGYETGYMP